MRILRKNISSVQTVLILSGSILISACGGGSPTEPPGGTTPPPPGQSTVRLTLVLPAINEPEPNQAVHRVHVISGTSGVTGGGRAGTPVNRAAVTLKGFSCSRTGPQATTCPVDIPVGQAVALVVEEGRSFWSGRGQNGLGSPPDFYPVEFVDWGGDFSSAEIVEPGFLRFTADRDRRIEARFRSIFPMILNMNVQGIGGIAFKVTIPPVPLLTLPASTLSANGVRTIGWGGKDVVQWFFIRTGSSVTLEPVDDFDRPGGCAPTPFLPCAEFLNWSGACTGSGLCTLTPKREFQAVTANVRTRTN